MFQGVFPIVPTIFDKSGDIDPDGFESVIKYAISAKASGLVFPANASEFFTLSFEERKKLGEILVENVDANSLAIIGVTANDIDTAVSLASHAQKIGADGLLLLIPNEFKGNEDRILKYVESVTSEAGLSVIIQNAPPPQGADLGLDVLEKIAKSFSSVKYLKEETQPTGQRVSFLLDKLGDELEGIFGGDGGRSILNELSRGACGMMPAIETTEIFVELFSAYKNDDHKKSRELFSQLLPLLNIQRVFKWAFTKRILLWRGLIKNDYVRAPEAPELDEIDEQHIRGWYQEVEDNLLKIKS